MLAIKKLQENGFANEQWSLVLWPRLNTVLLTNQIEFLDMFWWFDWRINIIKCISENCLSALWSMDKLPASICSARDGQESRKYEWRSFIPKSRQNASFPHPLFNRRENGLIFRLFCPRMWSLICVFPANTLIKQPSAKSSLIYTVQQNAPEKWQLQKIITIKIFSFCGPLGHASLDFQPQSG